MANSLKELEEKVIEAGGRLASLPASLDELFSLLDRIDVLLSRVEQSPSQTMLNALLPLLKALAASELLRHPDNDVKVYVASCISEVTRITAPEAPYNDDIMKEVFQMIVGAFEGLDDMSGRSFSKRVSILETVAKVRSCVVMLDLECDDLILQMFHYFLKTIRAEHPENVFSSMETIMTLVIDESEDISSNLLLSLLDTLKIDNKDVLPCAQKLAENVINACAHKMKPYLVELLETTGAPLNEYNKVVASICQNSDALGQNDSHASGDVLADDSKLSERTVTDELLQVSVKPEDEVGCPEKVGTADTSLVERTCNGTVQEQSSSPKHNSEGSHRSRQSKIIVSDQADGDALALISVKPEDRKKAKGRKKSFSAQKDRSKGGGSSQADDTSAEAKEHQRLSGSDNPASVTLSTPVESPPNSVRKRGRPPGSKKTAKHSDIAVVPTSKIVQEGPLLKLDGVMNKEPEDAGDAEVPGTITSDSEAKPRRNAGKKGLFKSEVAEQESSRRKQKPIRKQQKEEDFHGNNKMLQKDLGILGKDVDEEPCLKEIVSSARSISKASKGDKTHLGDNTELKSRKKRPLETQDVSATSDHKKQPTAELVGSKIKVWWPDDKEFYDGIVDSYSPRTKKHTIIYVDGDIEKLLLKDERWEYVGSDLEKDGGKQRVEDSPMSRSKKAEESSNTSSKEAKSQTQSKSGTGSLGKDTRRPRGRPRKVTSSDSKTPRSNEKLPDKPVSEPKIGNPRISFKGEEPDSKSKDMTSKSGTRGQRNDEPPKSSRKLKNETPKAGTKDSVSKSDGMSAEDSGDSKDSTPETASRFKLDGTGKKNTPRTKPEAGDSKENGVSSKGKTKMEASESISRKSDGETTATGRKRKRKSRK